LIPRPISPIYLQAILKKSAIEPIDEYLSPDKNSAVIGNENLGRNLAQMMANPMLPHEASLLFLRNLKPGIIPYDFKMTTTMPRKFCSEVGSVCL